MATVHGFLMVEAAQRSFDVREHGRSKWTVRLGPTSEDVQVVVVGTAGDLLAFFRDAALAVVADTGKASAA